MDNSNNQDGYGGQERATQGGILNPKMRIDEILDEIFGGAIDRRDDLNEALDNASRALERLSEAEYIDLHVDFLKSIANGELQLASEIAESFNTFSNDENISEPEIEAWKSLVAFAKKVAQRLNKEAEFQKSMRDKFDSMEENLKGEEFEKFSEMTIRDMHNGFSNMLEEMEKKIAGSEVLIAGREAQIKAKKNK